MDSIFDIVWEVGDLVRPSERMNSHWFKQLGNKPRPITRIRIGMGGKSWYDIKGFEIPFQAYELEFIEKGK